MFQILPCILCLQLLLPNLKKSLLCFLKKDSVLQNDYYVEAKESEYGGYDLKRYRDESGKYFYTEKVWENVNGEKVRKEIEREVLHEEFLSEVGKYPNALKIEKSRQSFVGMYEGREIHIDMDNVKFDHSPSMRYFIEAEILSENKEDVKNLKDLIIKFLKEVLEKQEIKEAEGMFKMAFKKL